MNSDKLAEVEHIVKETKANKARKSFVDFCRIKDRGFYLPERVHLLQLTQVLNLFYRGELRKDNGEAYKKLMVNMPPQFGKTRTLINFCQYVLGDNNENRIITGSYNDDTASDFSKYTRDGIQEERNVEGYVIFSDIFPDTKIKAGTSNYKKWALEGQHFNYLGSGIHGSFTGKGGTILIIDDPVKSEEIAVNEQALEKIWTWYTGTFLSRVSAEGGEPLEIIVMTRWATLDICGRILASAEAKDWYVIKMEAYNKQTKQMLCPGLLSEKRYNELRGKMQTEIFNANYHQTPIDLEGTLYKRFKTYTALPKDDNGNSLIEEVKNYTDTADEGDDFLCSINFGVYQGEGYLFDVYYTDEGMEVTEPFTAQFLFDSKVNRALIESNNGGRGFARNVQRILEKELTWTDTSGEEQIGTTSIIIKWFHQTENKKARIITNSSFVMEHIYYPVNWKDRWPEFYQALTSYQKAGKNLHDDGPDCISGVAEIINKRKGVSFFKK